MRQPSRLEAYWVFSILVGLLILFLLFDVESPQHPRTLTKLNVPIPYFHLVDLLHPDKYFTPADLHGQVVLLNVWASWCYPCQLENRLLLTIAGTYHVPVYSFSYQDGSEAAKTWLTKNGNPYEKIGMDNSGEASLQLGIIGTPETFLIDKTGVIRYQHVGALTDSEWKNVLWPLVREYENQ